MDTTTKYACALIPGLPLQALRRVQPEVGDCPLAIVHGHGSKALIVNASRAALQAGIFLGMSPVQAKSIAPAVILRSVSERVIDSARQALIDVAFSFSPNVMPLGGDSVVLDMTGLFSMYPSPHSFAAAIEATITKAGLMARIGIANGPRLARVAAKAGLGVISGQEATAIANLPVSALEPSEKLLQTLISLGITSVGQLASLGSGIGDRLGLEAVNLQILARGKDVLVLDPIAPNKTFQEAVDLEWTIDRIEQLSFLMSASIERLVLRLDSHNLVPSILIVSLNLEPVGEHIVSAHPAAPTADIRSLSNLVRRAIEKDPPPAPVLGFSLQAEGAPAIPVQGDLFGVPMPNPRELGALLGRLAVLAGADSVGAPDDDGAIVPFAPRRLPQSRPSLGQRPMILAARRLAELPKVQVSLKQDGRPSYVYGGGLSGPINRAAGPWGVEREWWTEQPVKGANWDVEVAQHGVYRLWHDFISDQWFIESVWD